MSTNTNTQAQAQMIDLADENFSFGVKVKKLADEIRIPIMITSVTLVGNEVFKAVDGKETISYKLGLGLTSNVPYVSESGEVIDGYHEFFTRYTASTAVKSGMFKDGIVEACGLGDASDLTKMVNALIGKKISAMTKYRAYKTRNGENRVAIDLEKFKALTTEEDFKDVEAVEHIPYAATKNYVGKKIITTVNGKAKIEVIKAIKATEPVVGAVELDEII